MTESSNARPHNQGDLDPEFDELVAQALDLWKFPGLSIAVVDGTQDFVKGYGIAKFPDTPVTPETLFYAGSTTKSFCAAAVSLLVDDEQEHKNIRWQTPLSELIRDDFVLRDPYWTEHTTLEDALSHRTGLPAYNKCCVGTGDTLRENVRKLRHLPTSPEPRTQSEYCNILFEAVSHAIEVVTGDCLGSFLARRIWQPLGMTSTYFSLQDAKDSGKPLADGYRWDEEKQKHTTVPHLDLTEVSGAGCNISSVVDYIKWVRMMIDRATPLSQEAHEALVQPLIAFDYGYPKHFHTVFCGLGWMILYYHGEKVILHPGGIIGFSALMVYLPQRAWGCIMMANSNSAGPAFDKLMWFLIDRLLDVPEAKRVDWDSWYQTQKRQAIERVSNARERIYPHATSEIRPSLPLSAYAGTYSHAAYPDMILVIEDGLLLARVLDRPWPFTIRFEHVTGEYFLARISMSSVALEQVVAAEFRVNPQGVAKLLRVRFEAGVEMIEFNRT